MKRKVKVAEKMLDKELINKCRYLSNKIRKEMFLLANPGKKYHFGGALSCIEIIVYVYIILMNGDIEQSERDNVILSKGHSCLALYILFAEMGYLQRSELLTYGQFGSRLQGHPHMKKLKYIDFSSGSLGQGLSVAVGMAIANKLQKSNKKVYVILGDGELQEGQIWEAAMCASHYNLENLVCFVDRNQFQVDGKTEEIMSIEPLAEKWRAFGWATYIVKDGHNYEEIDRVYRSIVFSGCPVVLILNTIKGKGISFMEGKKEWHSGYLSICEKNDAIKELTKC